MGDDFQQMSLVFNNTMPIPKELIKFEQKTTKSFNYLN
jgi:hypothetical protein